MTQEYTRGFPRVMVLPVPGIENAYVCISGRERENRVFGEKWYNKHQNKQKSPFHETFSTPCITFLYDAGNCCAEWDGEYGPVNLTFRVNEIHEDARQHWFYPFAIFEQDHWSQMAVTNEQFKDAFLDGDFEHIFSVLRRWAESGNNDYPAPTEEVASDD